MPADFSQPLHPLPHPYSDPADKGCALTAPVPYGWRRVPASHSQWSDTIPPRTRPPQNGLDTSAALFLPHGPPDHTFFPVSDQMCIRDRPVEINAYWYNALRIMERFCELLHSKDPGYGVLAGKVKAVSVSYTHLDVYKRQLPDSEGLLRHHPHGHRRGGAAGRLHQMADFQ